jgi:MoaA/NifB/PqqE/SkfB family radical SAM enzyme
MACSTLLLEIASNHLTRCYYVAFYCRQHGEIRAAIHEVPVDRFHPCPVCHLDCEYTLLGRGGTHRTVPFWDEVR